MKTMKIGTKAQADKVLVESLLKPVNGRALNRMKYSNGKYAPGSYIGREVEVYDDVYALYQSKGCDDVGPYVHIMCITEA